MPRLIIVSNRLPLSVIREGGEVRLEQSTGGLATGLAGPHEQLRGLWVGWPGSTEALSEDERARITRQLTEQRTVPVCLEPDDVWRFYEGFSNGVLWPLFHYLVDQMPLHVRVGEGMGPGGVSPMGVVAARFARLAADPGVVSEVISLGGSGECALLLAIDHLDYTKGIPRRLLAFDSLLRRHTTLRERVRLIQVAVPSRTDVGAYRKFRHHVDELVGRLNGAFATPHWLPVHYIYRGLSEREVVA